MTDSDADSHPESDAFEERSPEEAFGLLGNETRVAVLWALHDATDALSFSQLRDRVGVRDSGQFNYHLDKLVGTFVRRGEAGGYELTYAGWRVIGAILAGEFNKRGSLDPFEIDSTCGACGSCVEVDYTDEHVTIRCPTCDDQLSGFGFPPGAVEARTREDLPQALNRWTVGVFSSMKGGICPNCTGPMDASFVVDSEHLDHEIGVEFVCQRCTERAYSSVGSYVLYHPAVVAFHYDHGVNVVETPWWELPWLRGDSVTRVSDDPLRVRVTVRLDGDELDLVVDEDLTVTVEE